ncbi:MAG TPA: ATP-binding protein [Acetobacteraceae bacterium]|nr:ATP-binding protein [Acetobacteraceae bacterium]
MLWRRADKIGLALGTGLRVGRHLSLLRLVASLSWLVPLLLLALAGWQIWQQELSLSHARARSALGVLTEEAERVFEAQELALDWIDDHIRNQSWDDVENSVALHQFLVTLKAESSYIDSIWLFDAKGDVRATTRAFPLGRRINVADRDYFRSAEREGPGIRIGMPAVGRMTGTFAFHVVQRRSAPGDTFDGVILLALSPKYFENKFLSLENDERPTVMLMRADGAILASNRGPSPGTILPSDDPYLAKARGNDDGTDVFEARVDGRESLAGIQRLPRYPLYVTYAIDLASVRGELWEHLAVFGLVAIICSAILLSASLGAVRLAKNEQRALRGWQAETEQRQRMQAQMRQAFKMEALGRMAGGIAHHFNNLLPAMSGLLEQTLSEVPRNSATAQRVERMIDAVAQGRHLVRQILVFSRREIPGRERLSMAAITEGALALVQGSLPPNITTETNCRLGGDVLGDRAQLQEAMLNLLSNAVQAVGTRSGGRITLSVEDRSLDEQQARRLGLPLGDYIRVACRDNGIGMSEEVAERAFDPFFTTKPVGEGSGLGLAITHGIVASHKGGIYIESEPGAGTTVSIYLPKAAAVSGAARQLAAA